MRALGLEPQNVAAAAGISSSTLYRIMRADRGATAEPRLSTKRKLARALRTPMSTLFEDDQLELVANPVITQPGESVSLERLVVNHFRSVPQEMRLEAGRAAAFALVDLVLTLGGPTTRLEERDWNIPAIENSERLLLSLLHALPVKLQRHASKAAITAMLRVEWVAGTQPSKETYGAITRTNWSAKRLARDQPASEE